MNPSEQLEKQISNLITNDMCSHQTPLNEYQLRLRTKFNVEPTKDDIEVTLMGLKYHLRSK